jgi:hypothetical protein
MDITYLSLNMPRDSSLSTCKVCHFLQLEAEIVSHPALFHYNLFVMQVKLSLDWSDFINVQRRSYKFTSMQRAHQRISMSSVQNLLD